MSPEYVPNPPEPADDFETAFALESHRYELLAHDYSRIPPLVKAALVAWIRERRTPGRFVCAVLLNDLREAMGRADAYSLYALPSIVSWLYNVAPGNCWGSKENVEKFEAMPNWREEAP